MDQYLYWKDVGGILLNCLSEDAADKIMEVFNKGGYGGHIFWNTTTNKILRAGF